jgi:tetratricopeptide (TPR) repeat protein
LRSSRFVSLLVAVALASVAATARAESAKEAYNRGLSLYAAGSYKEAADAFLAAYKLKPKALILFNVGQAYRKRGDLAQARLYYHRFLDEAPPAERAPMQDETNKYLAELDAEEARRHKAAEEADRQEAEKLRFANRNPPAPTPTPPVEPPPRAPSPPVVTPPPPAMTPAPATTTPAPATTAPTVVATAAPAPERKRSVAKSWWLWTVVGVVVAGAAVGLGVGLGVHSDPSTALGTRQPSF